MARRRHEEEHENHERWLVSYADFITLLFAFFVVMYAISSVNENKYRILSEALGNAFTKQSGPPIDHTEPAQPSIVPPKPTPQERAATAAFRRERDYMTGIARSILSVLQPLVSQGKVRVTQTARGVSVEINASVLFAPGEAKLNQESVQALTAVAKVLKDDNHHLRIEGHTDNIPISNFMFPSNWELSAVRASSVVRLFMDNGISEHRMTAVGHASNQPLMTNDTSEGRQRNRRVQLMILTGMPETVTEVPVEAGEAK